jgi:hypothetical protein
LRVPVSAEHAYAQREEKLKEIDETIKTLVQNVEVLTVQKTEINQLLH